MSTKLQPFTLRFDEPIVHGFFKRVFDEYQRSRTLFGPFNNAHEGYAVILEELEEVWNIIKGNDNPANMPLEIVQLSAMVMAFWFELVVEQAK